MATSQAPNGKGFDEANWLIDPRDGTAIHRDDLKPCGTCGHAVFIFVERKEGESGSRCNCVCERCYPNATYRMKRAGDVIYARYDMDRKAFVGPTAAGARR